MITECLGPGSAKGVDWLLLSTDKGEVTCKQIWEGPGLAVITKISAVWDIDKEEAIGICEEAGFWFNDKNPKIDEPTEKEFVYEW